MTTVWMTRSAKEAAAVVVICAGGRIEIKEPSENFPRKGTLYMVKADKPVNERYIDAAVAPFRQREESEVRWYWDMS